MKKFFNYLKKEIRTIKLFNFLFLMLSGTINAIGVVLFLFPVKIYDSGVSGVSMFLDQITPSYLTLSLFLLVINVPIFIFGFKKQGFAFTVYSIFTIFIYSLVSFLITYVLPIDVSIVSPLAGGDLFLCSLFGGAISGVGSGLTIKFGGAIDGIDVLSVTFAKRLGITIGTFVLIFNCIFYIICGIVIESWILPLYSILTYFVGSKVVDFIVEGFNKVKMAMIITTKSEEVLKIINESFEASGTVVNAMGGYTKGDKKIIYFVINHFQMNKLKTLVRGIDNKAFITVQEVTDIIKNETN